jgi:hypothetical protein
MQHRAYEKHIAALPGTLEGGGSGAPVSLSVHQELALANLDPGTGLLEGAALTYGKDDYVDPVCLCCLLYMMLSALAIYLFTLQEGLDRMLRQLDKAEDSKNKWHRRRAVNETAVDYINDANRRFNEKVDRQMGKFTVDIKQSLERGTAM